ncbi:MAG: DUF2846 domain-containing protein [Spirochaetaceae bacterium]|nr:DUF2846 domain-containing protein [Spirochaetaceae bacterium]
MLKKLPFVLIVIGLSFIAGGCLLGPDPLEDTGVPAVIVTRSDDLPGNMEVFVDGQRLAKLRPGGKWGKRLANGRHSISVTYQKKRSEVLDFRISYNRQNFRAAAFENDRPGLLPY